MAFHQRSIAVGFIFAALSILALLVSPVPAHAQVAGATLSGLVTDTLGGPVPNATVSIRNRANGELRELKTDADGFYSAPNLLPGEYDITIAAQGFAKVIQKGITLTIGAQQALNQSLKVGEVTQSVEVNAAPPDVQTASSTISATVEGTTVRELPLNGRDWTSLAVLEPGVTAIQGQASTGSTSNRGNRGFGNQLSNAGHRPNENSYRVNGVNINDYANGSPGSVLGVNLGVDAIQEFSVLTTNYTAEYGRTSGAVINAITKTGTNQLHGTAYFFDRDKIFDARNFFDKGLVPPFRRIQFGGAAGGPIIKDKTFIFGDYEGIRQNLSQPVVAIVPSDQARAGNLCSRPPQPSAQVPSPCRPNSVRVDPAVQTALGLWPVANQGLVAGPTANGDQAIFASATPQILAENYYTLRVDHKLSSRDNLAGSYFFDGAWQTQPDALGNAIHKVTTRRHMASLEETHVFSSAAANTFRAGYNRVVGVVNQPLSAPNPLAADPRLSSVPGAFAPIIKVSNIIDDAGGLGSPSFFGHAGTSSQIYDDAFLVRHTHSLKFGFGFERLQYNLAGRYRQNGEWQFDSLALFLTNLPRSFGALDPTQAAETGSRQSIFAGYIQDDWRARSNLTLNLGVRYEMATLPSEVQDRFQVIQDLYGQGRVVPVKNLWSSNPTLKNFEPRVGFSWDPLRNGKTAVRGGFGIFDVLPLPYTYTQYNSSSYPFVVATNFRGNSASPLPQCRNLTRDFPDRAFPCLDFRDTTKLRLRYVEQNPHRSFAMNWNLNIQREVAPSWTAMVGYVGSRSLHLTNTGDDGNMVIPTRTSAGYFWPVPISTGTVMDPNAGEIRPMFFDGAASYHGLQAQLKKRMSHGFQVQASYTWGKCIDAGSTGSVGDMFLNSLRTLIFYAREARRGPCDFHVGQNFVANYLWTIPGPRAGSGLGWVLGGWELGGIFTASSGMPFTVMIGGDPMGLRNTNPSAFPDRVPGCDPINGNFKNDPSGRPLYLNTNCFTLPAAPANLSPGVQCQNFGRTTTNPGIAGTCANRLGNSGRNQLIGPRLINFDFSLFKNTRIPRISETFSVQFRAEFFNVFNHANFQAPTKNNTLFAAAGTRVATGGQLSATTTTSRQIQLGLKFVW
jgi:hypothetical protein